jgi:putative ABC transport system substrate-binding protein
VIARRRILTCVIAGATIPFAAGGQERGAPVIGFLRSTGAADSQGYLEAFSRGLAESGVVIGRDLVIEFGWAENRIERLPAVARQLLERRPALVVANGLAARAAKELTTAVPIVFVAGEDPVRSGLVASFARPEANVTGIAFSDTDLSAKRLGILHEMIPRLAVIGVLTDPNAPGRDVELKSIEAASLTLGRRILVVSAIDDGQIEAAFATLAERQIRGVLVASGPYFSSRRNLLTALARRLMVPASYSLRNYVDAGGLMSYGPSVPDAYRRAGHYAARILRGAKPGDLPVEMSSSFEMVINLRTAKELGLEIPPLILALADEVIE